MLPLGEIVSAVFDSVGIYSAMKISPQYGPETCGPITVQSRMVWGPNSVRSRRVRGPITVQSRNGRGPDTVRSDKMRGSHYSAYQNHLVTIMICYTVPDITRLHKSPVQCVVPV